MFKKIYIGILMVLLIAFDAYSFDNEITHRDITQKAVENSNLNNYLINNLGFQSGVETTINSISILKSLKEGSYLEDSPLCRASNHFHNPLKSWDKSHMSDDTTTLGSIVRAYCNLAGWSYSDRKSNVTWGTGYLSPGGSKTSISNQEYDWDDARTYYYQALTSSLSTDRETYFAKTFQTLGQVMHLLEDMAVPAHTRNDFTAHLYLVDEGISLPTEWFGNPFEDYVKDNPDVVSNSSSMSIGDTTNAAITRFWDTNQYTGSNPSTSLTHGLAEYTNANFFSDTTIFTESNDSSDAHYFPHPSKGETDARVIEVTAEDGEKDKRYYVYKTDSGYKLAAYAYFKKWLTESKWDYFLDDEVHKEYAGVLIPRVIGYSSGLLNYFFRGEIDMTKDPNNSSQYVIKNESSELMNGTFTLHYNAKDKNRKSLVSWNISIDAKGQSSSVSFTPPTDIEEEGKYILVFQGTLGNENDDAVVGKMVTLCQSGDTITISGSDAPSNGSQYTATGGTAPYTWSISKGSITSTDETGTSAAVQVSGQCGSATITATDNCGNKATKDIRLPSGMWVYISHEYAPYVEVEDIGWLCKFPDSPHGMGIYSGRVACENFTSATTKTEIYKAYTQAGGVETYGKPVPACKFIDMSSCTIIGNTTPVVWSRSVYWKYSCP